jgi:Helix-turn-helix
MSRREKPPETISGPLRAAMLASGKKAYTIGKLAGVDTSVIQKFMSGKRGLSLENVDRVAAALGLRLCQDTPLTEGGDTNAER